MTSGFSVEAKIRHAAGRTDLDTPRSSAPGEAGALVLGVHECRRAMGPNRASSGPVAGIGPVVGGPRAAPRVASPRETCGLADGASRARPSNRRPRARERQLSGGQAPLAASRSFNPGSGKPAP